MSPARRWWRRRRAEAKRRRVRRRMQGRTLPLPPKAIPGLAVAMVPGMRVAIDQVIAREQAALQQRVLEEAKALHPLWLEAPHLRPFVPGEQS